MAKVIRDAYLHEETVKDADQAVPQQVRRRARRTAAPVITSDPAAYATALRLAGGDVHRLRLGQDGSVTILNGSRRE